MTYGDVNDDVLVRTVRASDLGQNEGPLNLTAGAGFGQLPSFLSPPDPMPDIAYDKGAGRWLVVFQAAPPSKSAARGEEELDRTPEIYGRSVDGSLNASDLERISHDGEPGTEDFVLSREPAVAADDNGGGFLAVYVHGYPFDVRLVRLQAPPVEEIFSRRVNPDGTVAGDAQQVSDGPPEGSQEPERPARRPDVWHDNNADQFLVSWGQDITVPVPFREDSSIEYEVFAKKVDGSGAPTEADTQVSNHRPGEDRQYDGELPAVTYDRSVCDYVVSWTGEEFSDGSDEKQEIWDRAYDAPACPPGAAEQRTPGVGATAASLAAGQPAARVCASRRSFPIRLVKRRGREYVFALIRVNGQPVKVEYGDRVRSQVSLVGLPLGRFSVDIEARLKGGRTLKAVRRYFTCTKKLPPSNGLEREDAL